MGAVLLNPRKIGLKRVLVWVLGISSFIALLGVVQYYLPTDFLTHFGYSLQRGVRPSFAIDNEAGLTRIMSTLRDPNSLGAYLVLPITALTYLLVAARNHYKRVMLSGLLLLDGLALFMTFSRSAWAATVIAVLVVLWLQSYAKVMNFIARYKFFLAAGFVAVCAGLFFMRSSDVFQQYVIHTNPNRKTHLASNDYHALLVKEGIKGIIKKPQGHGPGTAGLASIQNPNGGQLTENYYVQIGYELGVVGLLAFGAFNVWLYIGLHKYRKTPLAAILCASFFGYLFMNMFLHTWSNEAVAAQFFLLAGLVLSSQSEVFRQKQ
jgi:O-antigen ligase